MIRIKLNSAEIQPNIEFKIKIEVYTLFYESINFDEFYRAAVKAHDY